MYWNDSPLDDAGSTPTHGLREETFDVLPCPAAADGHVDLSDGDIVAFARDKLGFSAEPAQMAFLKSDAKRGIVNCCRQFGKTTIMAIKAVYRAWINPRCLIMVVCPTERQAGLVLARIAGLVSGKDWIGGRLTGDRYNDLSLRFPNGSLVVGLPAKEGNIRGFSSVSLMIIDEASRVRDEVYKAVRPMLAVGSGDLWVLSTPDGRKGFFYEEFEFGGERWERFQVTAIECAPRITAEFLEDELAAMGAAWVKQEYFCEFIDSGGNMFDRVMVEEAVDPELMPLVFD